VISKSFWKGLNNLGQLTGRLPLKTIIVYSFKYNLH